MDITLETKSAIIKQLKEERKQFIGNEKAFAGKIGIHETQWSRLQIGNFFQVVSDQVWISLARRANINLRGEQLWKTAKTYTFNFITTALKKCQERGLSGIFCDEAGIGKSYAAKQYARNNKMVVYVDCSQVKSKQRLIRHIAREFGVGATGTYNNVYGDLCYYVTSAAHNPLVILDEAGDLDYSAFLELKALWNATEGCCGWYMMGADGLMEKINRFIINKKVGYTEIFSRYGKRYQSCTPKDVAKRRSFGLEEATLIVKANAPAGTDIQAVLLKSGFGLPGDKAGEVSLRRIEREIRKLGKGGDTNTNSSDRN